MPEPTLEQALPGANVPSGAAISPAGQPGPTGATGATGATGPAGPSVVSTDAGNVATIGSDSKIYVPDPTPVITSVRLRSFNSVGNCNFEVDQYRSGVVTNPSAKVIDRWAPGHVGTGQVSHQSVVNAGGPILLPGTNFGISANYYRITLTTVNASLAAGDYNYVFQNVEGPMWRELASDVHSVSILCRSSVANLTFGLSLRDSGGTRSLTKLCTLGAANTVTLIQLSNLPVWASGGGFVSTPGSVGYALAITLAAGTTFTSPANDTWQTGNFLGATGQMNFLGQALNSTFDLMAVQHEPGSQCTTLQDCPFSGPNGNLDACLRYYQKTYVYNVKPGTVTQVGMCVFYNPVASTNLFMPLRFNKPMAKIPTVTIWSPNTGVSGMYSYNGTTDTTASPVVTGDAGFGGVTSGGAPAAGSFTQLHYTADTGW
jgi:hypothetical protein